MTLHLHGKCDTSTHLGSARHHASAFKNNIFLEYKGEHVFK